MYNAFCFSVFANLHHENVLLLIQVSQRMPCFLLYLVLMLPMGFTYPSFHIVAHEIPSSSSRYSSYDWSSSDAPPAKMTLKSE